MEFSKILPKEDASLPNISKMMVLRFPENADILELCKIYSADFNVVIAEPNYLCELASPPNDPNWNLQWGLMDNRLNMPAAWNIVYSGFNPPHPVNGHDIIIAVIDDGIDTLHPDLRLALWVNENEIPDNEIDDDDNGYVDDVRGWNFNDSNNNIFPPELNDIHGTACAGIAAAVTNNYEGVAGIAGGWGASKPGWTIMPLRAFGRWPSDALKVIDAIKYAKQNGARIISMSLHFSVDGVLEQVQNAINDVYNNGCVLVAASGNGEPNVVFPARCDNVIAVGATIQADTAWSISSYGPALDVMAPGGDNPPLGFSGGNIFTTTLRSAGSYAYFSGTSAACPHVAGLAALLFSANHNLTNVQVVRIIKLTADTVDYARYPYGPDHWNERYGYGRINAYKAVLYSNDYTVPQAPVTLKSKTEYNKIYLSWNHNVEPNTGGYVVYYGNSSGNYTRELNIGYNNVCTLTVDDYEPVPYYIAIKAYSFLDIYSPSYSNEVFSYAGGNVRVQNNLIDAGNLLSYGAVAVNGANYNSPYGATWAKSLTYNIGANNSYYYNGANHYYCTWSDDGNILHDIIFSGLNSTFTAYYKKHPILQGEYSGNDIYALYWSSIGAMPPNFKEYKLAVWQYYTYSGKDVYDPNGWWKWSTIYIGKDLNYIHQLTTDQANKFRLYVIFNNGVLISNDLIVTEDNPDDPIVAEANTSEATAYSNGKKIIVGSDGKIHAVYVNGENVYYTSSLDDGETWASPVTVGLGKNPAIELTSSQSPTICWSKGNELYNSQHSADVWSAPQLIYTGPAGSEISYLAYVLDRNTDNSHLGWVDEGATGSAVLISPYTPGSTGSLAPTPIDQGGADDFKSPTLALDKAGNLKIAWSHSGKVYYKDNSEFFEMGDNGIHPIVDTYGDKTTVVWQEEIAPAVYQIVKKTKGINGWSDKQIISCPDGQNADFPVVAAAGQYVYSKNVKDGDYDLIYNCEYDNGWLMGTQNLSGAQGGMSRYPSIAFKQSWPKSKLYVLWTEEMPSVKIGSKAIASYIKAYTMTVDPVPCNYIDVGTEEYNSYNIQKKGDYYYGPQPEYTIDYHPTELKYSIQNLDPTKKYRIKVVYYQETDKTIKQTLTVDKTFNAKSKIEPKTVVTEEHWLPAACVKDGQIEISIAKSAGEYAVCSVIALYEYDRDCDGKSTEDIAESAGKTVNAYSYELMQNYPNPNTGKTAIKYQLAQPGKVSLKIYNTLGQVVKTLISQEQPAGYYNVTWDGKDSGGRQTSAGVYFYRMEAGDYKATRKMVVLK